MPELPEVETVRRTLAKHIVGRPISEVVLLGKHLVAAGGDLNEALLGNAVSSIRRRGKYLIFDLARGGVLILHLRMTGQLVYFERPFDADAHMHLILRFGPEEGLYFRDVRKFGRLWLLSEEGACAGLGRLGPEPFEPDFSVEYLVAALAKSRCAIKAKLLDQSLVAGIGNIYADEILFASFLHPKRISSSLNQGEIRVLHREIVATLEKAIDGGGTTFRDYVTGEGSAGGYQQALSVFRREGRACPRCGERILRLRCAGRSSFFCPRCQREDAP